MTLSSGQESQHRSSTGSHFRSNADWVLMLGLLYRREARGPEEVGREPSVSTPAHYLEYEESNAPCPWGRVSLLSAGLWGLVSV